MIPHKKVFPDSLQFSIYAKNLILRKSKEVNINNFNTDLSYHYCRVLDTLYIIDKIERKSNSYKKESTPSICLIAPDPPQRDNIMKLVNKNGYKLLDIYNHLQWDAIEGAPSFKYIIATNKKSYNKRELDLLRSKACVKLIFIC